MIRYQISGSNWGIWVVGERRLTENFYTESPHFNPSTTLTSQLLAFPSRFYLLRFLDFDPLFRLTVFLNPRAFPPFVTGVAFFASFPLLPFFFGRGLDAASRPSEIALPIVPLCDVIFLPDFPK
jgi:hypothetical protein